jgi:hypothetical protein
MSPERSEESRVLNGRIMFGTLLSNRITFQGALLVGIFLTPKDRSESQKKRNAPR